MDKLVLLDEQVRCKRPAQNETDEVSRVQQNGWGELWVQRNRWGELKGDLTESFEWVKADESNIRDKCETIEMDQRAKDQEQRGHGGEALSPPVLGRLHLDNGTARLDGTLREIIVLSVQ